MLDLAATGAQLLGELEARGAPEATLLDPADPRLPSAERARVRLEGRSRDALFPLLDALLSARFARVPRERRLRDLLIPARHLLGNAYKHGHGRDRGKAIRVELHATPRGALLRVSDEGPGFDVASALRRMREDDAAAHASGERRGAGLRALERARSRVAYEDGGRSALLRFLASDDGAEVPASDAGAAELPLAALERALAAELDAGAFAWPRVEGCRLYAEPGRCGGARRLRCVLWGREPGEPRLEARVVCARLLPSESQARVDFEAARALRARVRTKALRIPRPLLRLRAEPRLVVHDFSPWMALGEYLEHRAEPDGLERAAERTGSFLAALHASGSAGGPTDACAAARRSPIHGSFGFERVHYGADGRFYVDGFEAFRSGDPSEDADAFLADLAERAPARFGSERRRAASAAFRAAHLAPGVSPARLSSPARTEEDRSR